MPPMAMSGVREPLALHLVFSYLLGKGRFQVRSAGYAKQAPTPIAFGLLGKWRSGFIVLKRALPY